MEFAILSRSILLAVLALPLLGAAPAFKPLTCASPVQKGDTAASLKKRYGANARTMRLHVAEGEMATGMALWPKDPKRRVEVFFEDRPTKRVATVRIDRRGSLWRLGGVGVGSRLADVVLVNGGPVNVGGFGWDYGGGVDARGGKLARWPGGCRIGLVMDVGPEVSRAPDGVFGDGVQLGSDSAILQKAKPRVTKVFLSWRY
ncbi:MAG: hypothetical protein ABL912_10345 [Novosphingobium sp.]